MTTHIRHATTADIALLVALSRRTIKACYRSFLGDEAVDAFLDRGAVEEYVAASVDRCVVILHEGEIVGLSVARDNKIELMMIDAAVQRRGFGTRLLAHVEQSLFQQHDELQLDSFAGNDRANAFYGKHGWRERRRYCDEESRGDMIVFAKARTDSAGRR